MKTVLVPTNFSVNSTDALLSAASIVRASGGKLILLHNVETLLTNWPQLSETDQLKYPDMRTHSNKIQRHLLET